MRELGKRAGALAAGLTLLLAASGTAGAAPPKASYLLQGTRASAIAGAPDLVDVGPGNSFATETIDGAPRQVLRFPRGGGLSLATDGLVDPVSHSIVMNVRVADVYGIRRLLDFSGGTSDAGLYVFDGHLVIDAGGPVAISRRVVLDGAWAQVALTSEATPDGSQRTVVAVNGTPATTLATPSNFELGAAGLRLFKDNDHGPAQGEESAGAVACVLLYDGALTTSELAQGASGPPCPAPRPPSAAQLGFTPGGYVGRTSQGLPIVFVVGPSSVQAIEFLWRARCADGRVHTNAIALDAGAIRHRRFSVFNTLSTGGRARVSGGVRGMRASGRLSRWGGSAFRTTCVARGMSWHAHLDR